jgi:hypothetical protein
MRHLPIIASRTPAFAGLTESADGSTSGGSINRLLRRSAAYNLFRLPSTFLQCPAEPRAFARGRIPLMTNDIVKRISNLAHDCDWV